MQKLEEEGMENLVDKIIFVGVPQSGAPQAMAGLLYGYGEALPFDACAENFFLGHLCSLLGSRATARELAEHSPMAYHLLPAESYFSQVQDAAHPVAKFSGTTMYAEERASYGPEITSADEMYQFLKAEDGGRTKPESSDTKNANILSSEFLSYAQSIHESIDAWIPPSNVEVYQIAGWGVDTVAGVEFYEQRNLFGGHKEMYRPIFVEDGDGVVPVPSALQMREGLENVQEFWINLEDSSFGPATDRSHGDIFELNEAREFLREILTDASRGLPEYISSLQPAPADREKLIFFLHSPLTLELYDSENRHVGENINGGFDQDIPDVKYGEFGDVKYIIAPKNEYEVMLRGKASGTFSLDIQSVRGKTIVSTMTVADAPTTENTVVTLHVLKDKITPLLIDGDGDGTTETSITFNLDETVYYQSPTILKSSRSGSNPNSRNQSLTTSKPNLNEINNFIPEPALSKVEIASGNLLIGRVLGMEVSLEISSLDFETDRITYAGSSANFLSWLAELLYTWWKSLSKTITDYFR